MNFDDNNTCAICMEALSSDVIAALVTCGHCFHMKCTKEWENAPQNTAAKCPLCDEQYEQILRTFVDTSKCETEEQMKQRLDAEQLKCRQLSDRNWKRLVENRQLRQNLSAEKLKSHQLIDENRKILAENQKLIQNLAKEKLKKCQLLDENRKIMAENHKVKQNLDEEKLKNYQLIGENRKILAQNQKVKEDLFVEKYCQRGRSTNRTE